MAEQRMQKISAGWYVVVTKASNGAKNAYGPCTQSEGEALRKRLKTEIKRDSPLYPGVTVEVMVLQMQWLDD